MLNRLGHRSRRNRSNSIGPADSVKPAHPLLDWIFPDSLKAIFFGPYYIARSPLDNSFHSGLWRVATPTLALLSFVAACGRPVLKVSRLVSQSPSLSISTFSLLYLKAQLSNSHFLNSQLSYSLSQDSGLTVCPSTCWLLLTAGTRLGNGHRMRLGTGQWTQDETGDLGRTN